MISLSKRVLRALQFLGGDDSAWVKGREEEVRAGSLEEKVAMRVAEWKEVKLEEESSRYFGELFRLAAEGLQDYRDALEARLSALPSSSSSFSSSSSSKPWW